MKNIQADFRRLYCNIKKKSYLRGPENKTFSYFFIFTMLGVVKITQLAEPEACLVWWADVHRQTIALDEALISAVMSHELLPHWQVNFFKYVTLRSTFSFWSLKPKTSAAKIWKELDS